MCAALFVRAGQRENEISQSQRRDSESIMKRQVTFMEKKQTKRKINYKEHFLSRREFILAEGPLRLNRECQVWLVTSKTYFKPVGQDPN